MTFFNFVDLKQNYDNWKNISKYVGQHLINVLELTNMPNVHKLFLDGNPRPPNNLKFCVLLFLERKKIN